MISSLSDFLCVTGANKPDEAETLEDLYGDLAKIDLSYPLMASPTGAAGATNGQLPLMGIDMAWLQECVEERRKLIECFPHDDMTGYTDFVADHSLSNMSYWLCTFFRTPLKVSLYEVWGYVKALLASGRFVSNSAICDGGVFEAQMYPYRQNFVDAVKDLGLGISEADLTFPLKDWPADDPITPTSFSGGRHAFDKDMIFTLERAIPTLFALCVQDSVKGTIQDETVSGDEKALEGNQTLIGSQTIYRENRVRERDGDSETWTTYSSTRYARLPGLKTLRRH